jgi:hypothetical protein
LLCAAGAGRHGAWRRAERAGGLVGCGPMKLTRTQERVMEWLRDGHIAHTRYAGVVYANGTKLCNEATMYALERKGLVRQVNSRPNQWVAEKG